jgi:23S rRNA (cytosine1962-C5)-methyltransferase
VIQIQLERTRKSSSRHSHPWFLWKEVKKPEGRVPPGSVVEIIDSEGRWVGRGFYNGHARVRLRVLTRTLTEPVDEGFFRKRLSAALELRRGVLGLEAVSDAYRVVHSEADGLSGLVIDKLGNQLVIEYFSAGMFRLRHVIEAWLNKEFPGAAIYAMAEHHIQKQESFDLHAASVPAPSVIRENGLQFQVSPGSGHKTGFFVDQRENRQRFAALAKGKRVLDLCCHTGGFSVYAKAGGAASVEAVDLDPEAIAIAQTNAALNGVQIQTTAADVFQWLETAVLEKRRYDLVVLDPPKQTRSSEGIPSALRRYFAMNRRTMDVIESGGILVTCSCSGWIKEETFLELLQDAADKAGRTLQILHLSGAGADHPFLADVPEGRYLKVVWARVI